MKNFKVLLKSDKNFILLNKSFKEIFNYIHKKGIFNHKKLIKKIKKS
jgi:hypothetical protein